MTRTALTAATLIWFILGCATQSHEPGIHYYSWAGLYTVPPTPSDPLSKDEATSREKAGTSYYIAEYDPKGRLTTLEKRLDHKTFFKMTLKYQKDTVTVTTTNEEGKVTESETSR